MEAMIARRNRKWYALIALVLLIICSVSGFLLRDISQKDEKMTSARLLTKRKTYFTPLKIHGFSSGDTPYLEMTIENKTVRAELDLGYGGMVCLPADMIKELNNKKFIERIQIRGFRGKKYENNLYEIEKMTAGPISFFPVKVEEINLEFERDGLLLGEEDLLKSPVGKIGWYLFHHFNLLIDCKYSMCALCDSLETLKQQGYPTDAFTETPLLLDRRHIEFEAMTEAGPLRCVLDTGSTLNLLNKNLENGCNDHKIFTDKDGNQSFLNPENKDLMTFNLEDTQEFASFKIGEKEWGALTFNRITSPVPVNAIIGMEFIESALIFIDFSKHKIYFFEYPPEEEASYTEFLVKEDRLLFLRLLLPHSCLPACGPPSPPTTRSFLLNMRPRLMQNVSLVKIMKNDPPRDY